MESVAQEFITRAVPDVTQFYCKLPMLPPLHRVIFKIVVAMRLGTFVNSSYICPCFVQLCN